MFDLDAIPDRPINYIVKTPLELGWLLYRSDPSGDVWIMPDGRYIAFPAGTKPVFVLQMATWLAI